MTSRTLKKIQPARLHVHQLIQNFQRRYLPRQMHLLNTTQVISYMLQEVRTKGLRYPYP